MFLKSCLLCSLLQKLIIHNNIFMAHGRVSQFRFSRWLCKLQQSYPNNTRKYFLRWSKQGSRSPVLCLRQFRAETAIT